MTEHELLKARWEEVVQRLSDTFTEGETLGIDGIIYLIGVQEFFNKWKDVFHRDVYISFHFYLVKK